VQLLRRDYDDHSDNASPANDDVATDDTTSHNVTTTSADDNHGSTYDDVHFEHDNAGTVCWKLPLAMG
jgi:hypothetical protein